RLRARAGSCSTRPRSLATAGRASWGRHSRCRRRSPDRARAVVSAMARAERSIRRCILTSITTKECIMEPATIGLGITVLLNFGGVVWSFATLAAAVRELRQTTTTLAATVERIDHTLDRLHTRVAVLEDRQLRA